MNGGRNSTTLWVQDAWKGGTLRKKRKNRERERKQKLPNLTCCSAYLNLNLVEKSKKLETPYSWKEMKNCNINMSNKNLFSEEKEY